MAIKKRIHAQVDVNVAKFFVGLGLTKKDANLYNEWVNEGSTHVAPRLSAVYLDMFERLTAVLPEKARDKLPKTMYRGLRFPYEVAQFYLKNGIMLEDTIMSSWSAKYDEAERYASRCGVNQCGFVLKVPVKDAVIYLGPKVQRFLGQANAFPINHVNKNEIIVRGSGADAVEKSTVVKTFYLEV